MSERVQKVLAAAGVCSRRDAEAWIVANRVMINSKLAKLGDRVGETDTIKIDGRRLRLERQAPEDLLCVYHRDPGEPLRRQPDTPADQKTVMERLPEVRGRRWLALAPLSPLDGGLEVFSTDGRLRDAISKQAASIRTRYAIRVSGDWQAITAESVQSVIPTASFPLHALTLIDGAGRNRWLECEVEGVQVRTLRDWLMSLGFEVSRVLRVQWGPLVLERSLSRHRSLEIKGQDRARFYQAMGVPMHAPVARDKPFKTRKGQSPKSAGRGAPSGRGAPEAYGKRSAPSRSGDSTRRRGKGRSAY